MSDEHGQHQRRLPTADRGRAQDKSRDVAIIAAALELLGEKGYAGLTMTDVATRAGVSKATLYRRWTAKADLVADAVDTLDTLQPPTYPRTSLRDDLLALLEYAGQCDDDQPAIVTATMEMARSNPDLYRSLTDRSSRFLRAELAGLATSAGGATPLSAEALDMLGETTIALIAHYGGPAGGSVPREQLAKVVDHVLLVLIGCARVEP